MKRILFFCGILLYTGSNLNLNAQSIRQGEWKDHLSYFSCYRVAEVGDWIYASSESGLLSFNKNSYEIRKHSKATGLSDVQISTIAYAEESDYLIIGYVNGNIDLIREGEKPLNISDIKRKIMTADKRINQIFVNGSMAYLSCGFGIVVLNLAKLEIKETYILGESGSFLEIYDIAILDNHLYAATETGVFYADLNSPNLLDFHYWEHLDFLPESQDRYTIIEEHNDQIFAVYTLGDTLDKIIYFTPGTEMYSEWNKSYGSQIVDLNSTNGFFSISGSDRAYVYNQNDLLIDEFDFYGIQQTLITEENMVFFAATYGGLMWHQENDTDKYLLVDGPRFSEVSQVSTLGDKIWVSSGGPSRLYKHAAVHYIDNSGQWKSLTNDKMNLGTTIGNTYKIAIDPTDPEHIFVATYGYGLIEIRNEEVVNFFELNNTEYFSDIPEEFGLRIPGIQFDESGNLYFLVNLIPDPLFIIDAEGNWHNPEIDNSLLQKQQIVYTDLLVTSQDQIWILSTSSGAVVIEQEAGEFYRSKTILIKNQFGSVLSKAYCMEEDKEGNIWIGTNNGPIIYYSPWNIFEISEVSGYQVPIPRNDGTNIVDPLLFSESVFDIVTDGGNRKWIATDQSGVFLISDDGKKTLNNFNEENSPLLSNGVTGIGINEITGEVFFATDLGLISYGGIATEGLQEYTDVYVYPNPVRPEYEGLITITGLVANSIVKIADISGNLVWETNSLGGQAVWDGRNFKGDKVATGVYLVLLATENGRLSHITKILFLH